MVGGLVPGPQRFRLCALGALVGLLFGCWHSAAQDAIASDPAVAEAVGPAPGRRLTKEEYANTVVDLLGVALDAGDLYPLPDDQPSTGGGFRDDVAALLPSAVRTDAYEK